MPWYDKKWVICLFILLLWPVGLIMMWRSPSFSTKTKVIVTAVFALLFFVGYSNHDESRSASTSPTTKTEQTAPAKSYVNVDVNTMMADLERNAAAAQQKYKGQRVCVSGRIGVIDSNGDYLGVFPDDEFAIIGVTCKLAWGDKAQKNFLLNAQMNQRIRVYGEIVDVGEVLGYVLDVDKME